MKEILTIVQIVFAIAIIIMILMQSRGAGLGGIFGGSTNVYSTKRGVERFLFIATIIASIIFLGSALSGVILF
ncbi:MAG: preprotein translocase subunit SecG [Patescibacteria group bacterium]